MSICKRPEYDALALPPVKVAHFTLQEFFVGNTDYDRKSALSNMEVISNILQLSQILSEVRSMLCSYHLKDVPILINSGYRSVSRNKLVGGVSTSQHLTGSAVDIHCEYNEDLYNFLRLYFDFGQIIRYDSFIHFSLPSKTNHFQIIDKRTK